jgi:hypothetical protein
MGDAGSAGNNDIVNASGDGINLLAGSAASIFGSGDSIMHKHALAIYAKRVAEARCPAR